MNKKKNYAFPIILTIVVLLLLSTLGGVIYMIVDKLSDTSGKKSRDDDDDDNEETSEEVSVETTEAVPFESMIETAGDFEEVERPSATRPPKRPGILPSGGTSDATAAETVSVPVENIPEFVYEDGSKEVYSYDENGNIVESIYYNADGAVENRRVYSYGADGVLTLEKRYNADNCLVYEAR